MRIPLKLTKRLTDLIDQSDIQSLIKHNTALSNAYRSGEWKLTPNEKLCYAACRMPATYATISYLTQELQFQSVLDVGAGPGTAAWALDADVTAIEHDKDFITLGKQLNSPCTWTQADYTTWKPITTYDLILFSYSYGETQGFKLAPYFSQCQHNLLIIEPGTPTGWQNILRARDELVSLGAHIWGPCPHHHTCPLNPPDWCHFGIKLERTDIHKRLKQATLGYEEEKFSYLLVGKTPKVCGPRILRPPQKRPGHILLKLCTQDGLKQETVTKKNKSHYQKAKKGKWGSCL